MRWLFPWMVHDMWWKSVCTPHKKIKRKKANIPARPTSSKRGKNENSTVDITKQLLDFLVWHGFKVSNLSKSFFVDDLRGEYVVRHVLVHFNSGRRCFRIDVVITEGESKTIINIWFIVYSWKYTIKHFGMYFIVSDTYLLLRLWIVWQLVHSYFFFPG